MHADFIIFLVIAIVWLTLFVCPIIIDYKAMKYIKKEHHQFWIENVKCKCGISVFGGPIIYQYLEPLHDSTILDFKSKRYKAIKHLFSGVFITFLLLLLYIVNI